jgi:hypothetical protein
MELSFCEPFTSIQGQLKVFRGTFRGNFGSVLFLCLFFASGKTRGKKSRHHPSHMAGKVKQDFTIPASSWQDFQSAACKSLEERWEPG